MSMVVAAYLPVEHILQLHHLTEKEGKGAWKLQVSFPFYPAFISRAVVYRNGYAMATDKRGSVGMNAYRTGDYLPSGKKIRRFQRNPLIFYMNSTI